MPELVATLTKAAPFGGFCLLFLYIQHRSNSKAIDKIEKTFNTALKTIQENYKDSLEILKDAQNSNIKKRMKEK